MRIFDKHNIKNGIFLIIMLIYIFGSFSFAQEEISAEIINRTLFTAAQVNEQGLIMEIQLNGSKFKSELSDEDRESIISKLFVDLDEGHIDDGEKGNLSRLQFIKETRIDVLVPVGVDSSGQPIDSIDRFLSYEHGIQEELRENGEIFINDAGNLVIQCKSPYFDNLANNIIYTNGGVPVAWGDIPIYITLPSEILEGVEEDLEVSNFYAILEMKARVEIFAYDDEDAKKTRDIDRIHIVDNITEEDIRAGGKLLKVTIDSRNGPTNWSVSQKPDPRFIQNTFRTERDFNSGDDNAEWLKIESELGANLEPGNKDLANWNGYWLSKNIRTSNEKTLEEMGTMYYILEIPTVKDFNIDSDMNVYISLLAGMGGGSGKSGAQAMPYWGHDGRLWFTVLSGDDADLSIKATDQPEDDTGFGAGSGEGLGNEGGSGSGSQEENRNQEQNGSSNEVQQPQNVPRRRVQQVNINEDPNATTEEPLAAASDQDEVQLDANSEDMSQGSAGEMEGKSRTKLKVYDISDQIADETKIEKLSYGIEKYVVGMVTIVALGAVLRYMRYSRYIL